MIRVSVAGRDVSFTGYWRTKMEADGEFMIFPFCSTLHLFVPESREKEFLSSTRLATKTEARYSSWDRGPESIEIVWSNEAETLYSLSLRGEQIQLSPFEKDLVDRARIRAWTNQRPQPNLAFEQPCRFVVSDH